MIIIITLNPVKANETNLLLLLSKDNLSGKKHAVLNSCEGLLNRDCCEHNKSATKHHSIVFLFYFFF